MPGSRHRVEPKQSTAVGSVAPCLVGAPSLEQASLRGSGTGASAAATPQDEGEADRKHGTEQRTNVPSNSENNRRHSRDGS